MLSRRVRPRRVAGDHPQHHERPGGEGISLPPAHLGRPRSHGRAYRLYVDSLMRAAERRRRGVRPAGRGASPPPARRWRRSSAVPRRASACSPRSSASPSGRSSTAPCSQRVELVRLSAERVLMVLTLRGGAVRTHVRGGARARSPTACVAEVARGAQRAPGGAHARRDPRDARRAAARRPIGSAEARRAAEHLRRRRASSSSSARWPPEAESVVLGQASLLADQPEFSNGEHMRRLLALTERATSWPACSGSGRQRAERPPGISITIGNENADPRLDRFTLVTAEYHAGALHRRDRRHRSHAHAVRKGDRAGEPHFPAAHRAARLTSD